MSEVEISQLNGTLEAPFKEGTLIRIPENTTVEKPIHIDSTSNVLVIAEKNTKAVIVETSKSETETRKQIVEVIVKENSYVEYITVQNLNKTTENFCKRNATVGKNSFIYWIDCAIGSKFTQNITTTNLNGEGAESKSWGIIFGDEDQYFDFDSQTAHSVSRTTSDMVSRVVLNDKAKANYKGLVKINPNAVGCKGYQKEDTILLSDDAKADVVPNLEINNNDVQCSHGATVSQIDEDKLFYMMSRGLDDKTAKKSIVEGFFDPILVKIDNEKIKTEILNSISQRIGSL